MVQQFPFQVVSLFFFQSTHWIFIVIYIANLLRFVGVLGHHCIINTLFSSNFTEFLESWKDLMTFVHHFQYTRYFCCLHLKWCSCWNIYLVVYVTERTRNSKNCIISHLRNFNAEHKPESFHQSWAIKKLGREDKKIYTSRKLFKKFIYIV